MKKTYKYPQIEMINMQTSDIITASQTLLGFKPVEEGDGDSDYIDIVGLV